jgi:hypothetical protein
MKLLGVHQSDKPEKKMYAELQSDSGRTKRVYFGQAGATDFVQSKDPERKKRYIARHQANEDWSNPESAGFWSRWVLWNYTNKAEAIADATRRANRLL